ncbi:MAG: LPS-assembly protein LptD [Bacteroidales bacterium]|nr:LPS-assembly protein LptD [Candidatus Cacconaster merdequi]
MSLKAAIVSFSLMIGACIPTQAGPSAGNFVQLPQDTVTQQKARIRSEADTVQHRETAIPADTDTISHLNDGIPPDGLIDETAQDTLERPVGTIDRPAFSAARDSVIEDMEHNIIHYFGDVTASYGTLELKADYMAYNTKLNTVYAKGFLDSITNTFVGKPTMKDGAQTYEMEELYYNFTSRKAKIKNMTTQQQEGNLIGENLKMMPDQSINIKGGKYTVCDAPHPHYYLKMTTAKIMTKPRQRTMFGPAYVVVEDVPLPVVVPFGFVPDMPTRASGLLMPTYGEEQARGMYLKDLGYAFLLGDHFDLAITGDIYTYGSWALRGTSRYKKRYSFDGSLSVNYSNDVTGERGSKDFFQSKNFGVNWTHSQDPKAHPGTSFRASVNFSSPSNNRFNSHSINESLQNQISSSISYSKTWSGVSLSINALHSQNSRDSSYSVTLPNVTLTVNRFYPFKRKVRVGKERFYEQISFSYNTSLQNKVNFKASEFAMNKDFVNKIQNGMNHSFSIGLPGFTLLKFFQFSPNINYGMNWYFREQYLEYNPDTDKVETKYTNQFSTLGISQNYSGGISMSTRIYGMFNFGRKSRVQAIRHMITPSFSLGLHPELGTRANGYTSYTYIDNKGESHTVEYNKYSGMLNSPPGKGRSASLSFSFANNLEAKVRKKPEDLANEEDANDPKKSTEKLKLIDQLNVSGSYNFLADSLKLSNISISGGTTVFGKLGINGNMTLNPYAVDENGHTINKLNFIQTGHIARVTNASASLSYSINGGGDYKGNDGHNGNAAADDYARVYYHPVTGEFIPGGWLYYINPNTPWSLNFNYSYSFSRSYRVTDGKLEKIANTTQTLGFSGQMKLTKRLNFNFNSGWDFTQMKLSTTQISASYDLHCFAISVSWIPTGQWESWSFRIAAKASALADLLQFRKSASYWDN